MAVSQGCDPGKRSISSCCESSRPSRCTDRASCSVLRFLIEDVFQVTPGALFPALRRLEDNGWAVRLFGCLREQPQGALLPNHEGGTEAAGPREAALEVHHRGRREGAGGRMRRAWSRLRAMLRRLVDGGAKDAELSDELRAFVEHDAESRIRSGMTPEDARRAALIELGGAEQVKEHVRDTRAGARLGRHRPGLPLRHAQSWPVTWVLALGDRESQSGPGGDDRGVRVHQRRARGPSIIPGIQDQDRLVEDRDS